jgi:hypothetical protein
MNSQEIIDKVLEIIHEEGHDLPNTEYFDMIVDIIGALQDEISANEESIN